MNVAPEKCQKSACSTTIVKREPVEAEPLASPKRDVEFVFVKVEAPCLQEWETPEGHIATQDPPVDNKEECSHSEDFLLSSVPNIVKVEYREDEEATHVDNAEECSVTEDFVGPSTSNTEEAEDKEEEDAAVSKDDGQEVDHELESTGSGSEPESPIPAGVEDNSGKDDRGGLASSTFFTTGTVNMKQSCTELKASIGKLLYSCNMCHKTFTKSYIRRHIRAHTGGYSYICDFCNKTFTDNAALKRHLLLHTGERPYRCGICNKTFTQSNALKRHSYLHTGERPHSCAVCNKTFTQNSTLKKHLLLHTGELPYSCQECHKRFRYSTHLKVHLRLHTGERPYSCNICQKKFSQKSNLKKHIVLHMRECPSTCDAFG